LEKRILRLFVFSSFSRKNLLKSYSYGWIIIIWTLNTIKVAEVKV